MAGIDIVLVGDSASMVVHGHDTTLPITLEEMIVHAKSVKRGTKRAMIIGDMPFGSYEENPTQATRSALRLVKEAQVDGVKLEGTAGSRLEAIKSITDAGVPVIGHIGLTPQSFNAFGGFRPQGKTARDAIKLVRSARELQMAGCIAIVVECVPNEVAQAISESIEVPTIGIGAGPHTNGQILVYHDILGMSNHPHHRRVAPRFCKQYADIGSQIHAALSSFKYEVEHKVFPSTNYCPYKIQGDEIKKFSELLCDLSNHDVCS